MSTSIRRHAGGGSFEAVASYSRAVRVERTIVVSGCAALDASGAVRGGTDTGTQTAIAIDTALAAVEALGGTRATVTRTRLLLAPEADWRAAVEAHGEAFRGVDPANTTYVVHGFVAPGVLVEIEMDAVADD